MGAERLLAVLALLAGLDRHLRRWDGGSIGARLLDATWIVLAALFLLLRLWWRVMRPIVREQDLSNLPAAFLLNTMAVIALLLLPEASV